MELDGLNYEDYEDFNLWVDDGAGPINISGETFRASEVLFNMKRETYRIALSEFESQQFDELQEVAHRSFPACIAYNYRLSEKGFGANDSVKKFLHLKDTWESSIFVLYALVLGEIRTKRVNLTEATINRGTNPNGRFNTNIVFTDALKQKLENIRAILNFSKETGLNLLCEQNIKEELLIDLLELQNNRNGFSHSALPTVEQANAELANVLPLFKRVLKSLRFLEEVEFIRFVSFTTNCRFEVFKGHYLNKEFEDIGIEPSTLQYVMTSAGEVILAKWEGEVFSLSPFLHYVNDTSGHETYLCVFKSRKNSKFWYEPVKLRNEVCFDSLQARFDAEKTEIQSLLSS